MDEFELLDENREEDDTAGRDNVSFFSTLANEKEIDAQNRSLEIQALSPPPTTLHSKP